MCQYEAQGRTTKNANRLSHTPWSSQFHPLRVRVALRSIIPLKNIRTALRLANRRLVSGYNGALTAQRRTSGRFRSRLLLPYIPPALTSDPIQLSLLKTTAQHPPLSLKNANLQSAEPTPPPLASRVARVDLKLIFLIFIMLRIPFNWWNQPANP